MNAQRIGVDTGFFFSLQEGDAEAIRVMDSDAAIVSSTLVLAELIRQSLKGKVDHDLLGLLKGAIDWVPVTEEEAEEGARISHGVGIPLVDSVILASFLKEGCGIIYTTDSHLESFTKKGVKIVNLKKK